MVAILRPDNSEGAPSFLGPRTTRKYLSGPSSSESGILGEVSPEGLDASDRIDPIPSVLFAYGGSNPARERL